MDLGITGNKIKEEEKKHEEDYLETRVLKGLPDYSNNPELKELALTLKRDIIIENPDV